MAATESGRPKDRKGATDQLPAVRLAKRYAAPAGFHQMPQLALHAGLLHHSMVLIASRTALLSWIAARAA
jgi:hypothetical protein